ncbi:Transcriptional regulator, TetR family [Candidatus Rhodobacter oscarellae]|uniref:Transcriptional regulator, TetR family n=1 Tax=Candidatus Rhodobacter oscarellae TaxID=1675527 RepID=A0A0J9E9C8_9RHOB|nr:TetR/AcrR family transcriptional regulator [Candidatus Rhodobacter lobularis]KMW58274.1 Transcriptional regulator, TetR family [Candidatus Rhodobacter lobularis]
MAADTNSIDKRTPVTRRRDKDKTIAALKRAARQQLILEGGTGLSIQPILNMAGVSRGALFHHFPTKNHLIAAAFFDLMDDMAERLGALGEALREGSIGRSDFVERVRDAYCSDIFVGSMDIAVKTRAEPELRALVDEGVDDWYVVLAAFWQDTFELPGFGGAEADQHWVMASNLLRGHAFASIYRSTPEIRRAFCASFEEMILAQAVIKPLSPQNG